MAAEDVIGGIEARSGKAAGLELIDEVFPRFRLVPSIALAPRFCEDPAVAVVMAAKCEGINGLFRAVCAVDIPTSGENAVTRYADVPGYKEKHNLTDPLMFVCWPKVRLDDHVYGLATHLAGLMAATDAAHESIPYASPSNKRLEITSCGYMDKNGAWQEVWLDLAKANYLNGQGVYTVSSFDGGLKSWGGRMACYPANTDPKDAQDSIRRFFNWYMARFILTYFSRVDEPLTRRLVQTFLKSEQIRLDGYTATETLSGSGIAGEIDNPTIGITQSMTCKLSFTSINPEVYYILDWTKTALYECYAALQVTDDATGLRDSIPERINMLGRAKSFSLGSREQGKKHGNEVELELTRLETYLDGEEKLLIDKLNFIHRVNGADLLKKVRSQIGLNV